MKKKPFCNQRTARRDRKKYPTPFHLYDEKGIRENAKAVKEAFPGIRDFVSILR